MTPQTAKPGVVPQSSEEGPIHVLVAGVPYSHSRPFPDGRWLTDEHRREIEGVSPRINLMHMSRDELAAGAVPDFAPEVIMTETTGTATQWDDAEWLKYLVRGRDIRRLQSPRLRWLQSCSHGIETVAPILGPHVTMVRALDVHGVGLAESVFAAILMHTKKLSERAVNQANHDWVMMEYGELYGRSMVILGTGSLGTAVARLAKAFGMNVIGVRRTSEPDPTYDEVLRTELLATVLGRADYLVSTLPKTPLTTDLISTEELALLPEHSFVVNVGRGEVVNETALAVALREGRISGAYLDVFAQEPLDASSALWDTPNLRITPHDAHYSGSVGDRNVAQLCDNLRRYIAGEPLRGIPDLEAGY